jgi:putative transposase
MSKQKRSTKQSKQHRYPSDITDTQWSFLAPLFEDSSTQPARVYEVRDVLNAIFYVNRTGCQWDYLPPNFPQWKAVYNQFDRWKKNGTWDRVHDTLRDKTRTTASRNPQPTAAVIDAQSTKTTEKGGLVAMMLVRRSKAEKDTSS